MKHETRTLLNKAVNSLLLSVEHFNRPVDRGRCEAVLIFMDHAFEMLLKAAILQKGGKIIEPGAKQTIGFDTCVGQALSAQNIMFLTAEQAISLRVINSLRDAAQHHILEITEQQLYIHAQTGFTLFRDILRTVFNQELNAYLPDRVLPISTTVPINLVALFESELAEIEKMLSPGRRKRMEALARLLPLTILDTTINGSSLQPSTAELRTKINMLQKGLSWEEIFPGVASIQLAAEVVGPSLNLRITKDKNQGIPVTLVPENTPGAVIVAVKRVDELGFYNLGRNDLAEKVELSGPRTTAIIWALKLQNNPDYHKRITIGKTKIDRYSQSAITAIKEALQHKTPDEIWNEYRSSREQKHNKAS
jgi:hypothetical protein